MNSSQPSPDRQCLCGSVRDRTGRCMHCDYPARPDGVCKSNCAACAKRDHYCEVCRTWSVTVGAARVHQIACWKAQARRNTERAT